MSSFANYSDAVSALVSSLLSEFGHIGVAFMALSDLYNEGWRRTLRYPYIYVEWLAMFIIRALVKTEHGRSLSISAHT